MLQPARSIFLSWFCTLPLSLSLLLSLSLPSLSNNQVSDNDNVILPWELSYQVFSHSGEVRKTQVTHKIQWATTCNYYMCSVYLHTWCHCCPEMSLCHHLTTLAVEPLVHQCFGTAHPTLFLCCCWKPAISSQWMKLSCRELSTFPPMAIVHECLTIALGHFDGCLISDLKP